jgi:hypothetical protein
MAGRVRSRRINPNGPCRGRRHTRESPAAYKLTQTREVPFRISDSNLLEIPV